MLEFVAFALLAVLLVALWGRTKQLSQDTASLEEQVRRLTKRVFELEQRGPIAGPPPAPPPLPQPEQRPLPQAEPEPVTVVREVEPEPEPEPAPVLAPAAAPRDWEALIGGNLLNKLGALVLVIGVALFLAYGVTQLGPGGRIAVGMTVGVSLLAAGVAAERRERYTFWARGVIAGGWAIVYFTTYAMHAVPAARIVESQFAGALLLFLVAAAFVTHSLRYRSEVVTGLAYTAAFLALVLAPRTPLSLQASVPLAASLVWVSSRFGWRYLAAGGLVFTYAAFAAAQPPHPTWPVLWIYWLLFEAYDQWSRRGFLMPLNSAGFLGASMLLWRPDMPGFDVYLTAAAVAQIASAALRMRLRGREETVEQTAEGGFLLPAALGLALLEWAVFQRFEGPPEAFGLLLAAELAILSGALGGFRVLRWIGFAALVPALVVLFDGLQRSEQFSYFGLTLRVWTPVAVLFASAMFLNRAVTRWSGYTYLGTVLLMPPIGQELPAKREGLGWMALAAAVLQFGIRDRWRDFRWAALGCGAVATLALSEASQWPVAFAGFALAAGATVELLYLGAPRCAAGAGAAAVMLAAVTLLRALPAIWVAPAWAALCAAAAIIAVRFNRLFAAVAGGVFAVAILGRAISSNLPDSSGDPGLRWGTVLLTVLLLYAAQAALGRELPVFTAIGTFLLTSLLVDEASGRVLTMALAAEGVGLLIAGFALRERPLRISGLGLFLFCVLKVFLYDLRELDTLSRILSFVVLGLLLLGASWIYTRFREQIQRYL
ncbi:MAG: DUF2339 domain-containing protein [Bryobacteraceae bacterium]|nr:DUF2339 domain-containing protein [Bryobacteraceae bacterium]